MSERIAKIIARAGICSRRSAEEMILSGRVKIAGQVVLSPAIKVNDYSSITVDNKALVIEKTRLWLYHKEKGLITSHRDEKNRATVFNNLPHDLPRVISIGRLDYNTEGLLLLTNDGEFARKMELPSSNIKRQYKVRTYGQLPLIELEQIQFGITINGIYYKPVKYSIISKKNMYCWFDVEIFEGKNREIRKIFEHFNLQVTRLIRVAYGAYKLGDLQLNQIKEVLLQQY